VQIELAPGGPQESAGLPVLPLPRTMPSPAGAVVIVPVCVPATWPAADAVIVGFPGVVDPYQNVTVLSPLGIVTLVTGAAANCVVPKVAPLDVLLVRSTVCDPPVVIGLPEPVWRRTVMGPRFGVLEVAPDTAGELITSVSVSMVSVKLWVPFGLTPFATSMHTV
jgi:hypothetical protein